MSEWIKLHAAVFVHPKTLRLAKRLGIPPAAAAGHMAALWCWALEYAPDGDLTRFDEEELELAAGWQGDEGTFLACANTAGFLDRLSDGERVELHIHDWTTWGGTIVERKTRERERQAERRAAARQEAEERKKTTRRPEDVRSTTARRTQAEEKRREERRGEVDLMPVSSEPGEPENDDVPPLEGEVVKGNPPAGFEEFWSAYPRHDARVKAVNAWRRLNKTEKRLATGVAQVMGELVARSAQERRFVPYGATFLNGKRWEDWREGVPPGWSDASADRAAQLRSSLDDALARIAAEEAQEVPA